VNVCAVVPDGVVIFFTSYTFEQEVYQYWQNHGTWATLATKKTLFREPRYGRLLYNSISQQSLLLMAHRLASETEAVLDAYAHAINGPHEGKTSGII
jgi:Rad3-related DNA helicase